MKRTAKTSGKSAAKTKKAAPKKTPRPNPFHCADDIYLTKNKIAVTCLTSRRTERGYELTKKVKYYVRSPGNMKQLKALHGDIVRVGKNGNKYTRI